MVRPGAVAVLGVLLVTLLGPVIGTAGPAGAAPACPAGAAIPPPAVDTSEVPVTGQPGPPPLPTPPQPVGGPRMGECGVVVAPGTPTLPGGVGAATWLVADLDSGAVLAARDPHARHRPASLMKVLTALVVVRRLNPDTVVVGTQGDADQEGSRAGVGPGGVYTVRQLLAGLLLNSGNDAAHALAGQLGGPAATVGAMTGLAAQLGALDTRPANPSGLDGPGMSTSAYDLALMFRVAMREPLFAQTVATRVTDFPGWGGRPGFRISNDNKLLAGYPGALGGKTGFTDDARHTYVGAAERGGRRLVVVLLRGEQAPVPTWQQAALLLDWGFALPVGTTPVGALVDAAPPAVLDASATATGPDRLPYLVGGAAAALTALAALGSAAVGLARTPRARWRQLVQPPVGR